MRVAIISVYTDYRRRGEHHRGALQPQIGPLIAALLPPEADVVVINDTWDDPDWSRAYDLVFISSMHADFDRARQISHYYRNRGAQTVVGGVMASTYPSLAAPYFDAIVIGDPEGAIPTIYADCARRKLKRIYRGGAYQGDAVPTPRFDLVAHQSVIPLGLEVTRGCPFTCEFCALTAFGTRFETRSIERVVRDITVGRKMLERAAPFWKQRLAMFYDNNLGGQPRYLRAFCEAIAPLGLRWATSLTFNIIANPELVKLLHRAGCRAVFVGLESFNPDALQSMGKHQNILAKMRDAIDRTRDAGILVTAGLMVSPTMDTPAYIDSIPERLDDCGLHVPSFLAFETPIPGTPLFTRLAGEAEPAFMPNALLRDFSGYTLATRPRRTSVAAFIGAYRRAHETIYRPQRRLAKLVDDLPRFWRAGSRTAALIDVMDQWAGQPEHLPSRTFIAGTEPPPLETVPLLDDDFRSEFARRSILEPWVVTDGRGRPLSHWLNPSRAYESAARRAMPIRVPVRANPMPAAA
jgi:pyruvate-formate lyase-activating enzyme